MLLLFFSLYLSAEISCALSNCYSVVRNSDTAGCNNIHLNAMDVKDSLFLMQSC